MGSSISSENAFSGSVGFKSCLYTISSEELCTRNERKSYGNTERILKERLPTEKLEYSTSSSEEEKEYNVPIEKLEYSTSSSEEEKESNVPIEKLEYSTSSSEDNEPNDSDVLPGKSYRSLIEDLKIHERSLILEQRDVCKMMKIQPHSFDVDTSNDLIELASELLHLHISSDEEGEVIEEEDTCLGEANLSSAPTLLSCSKPVSAIKGSRSQNGKVMSEKARVKWAADVYDPPVTSSSHTVKGRNRHRHHHPKSKKEYYRTGSKHSSKGKSSKGGGASDVKQHNTHRKSRHNTSTLAQSSRLQPLESSGTVVNTCIEAKTDAQVHSKETIGMYGSSCYMEQLAPLALAVAKVS